MIKIGIIGLGSMGTAVLQAILLSAQKDPTRDSASTHVIAHAKSSPIHESNIGVSVHSPRSQANADRFQVRTFASNIELVKFSDLVIIAVKPKDIKSTLAPLKSKLKGKAILSVAAGYGYDDFANLLDSSTRVMVTLPNLALSVGSGVIGIGEETTFTKTEREFIAQIFTSSAELVYLPSKLLGALSSLSGSGPAFLALVASSMIDAGVKQGIPHDTATRIVSSTFTGTGMLMEEVFASPDALKMAVCSPGGTSIAGIASLEQSGVPGAFIKAIDKTTERFNELAKG
ncbi:MAG: pyrroline-5-carboxylate reductase [Candidatus Ancillula sp.]|nr:pyrroline-5-carboxylate reductase [Candidatus Ancillula sp.]